MPSVSYALRGAIAGWRSSHSTPARQRTSTGITRSTTQAARRCDRLDHLLRNYASYSVYYRKVGGGTAGRFQFGRDISIPTAGEGRHPRTRPARRCLCRRAAAGDYEIYSWHVGSGYALVGPSNPFTVRYHIEPGKSVYSAISTSSAGKAARSVTGRCSPIRKRRSGSEDLRDQVPKLGEFEIGSSIEKGQVYDDLAKAIRP